MASSTAQPGYYPTVRYIYQHIEFHVSEDEAYTVLDTFIHYWNQHSGELVYEQEFRDYVYTQLQWSMLGSLGKEKIFRMVDLILEYLKKGGFYQAAA